MFKQPKRVLTEKDIENKVDAISSLYQRNGCPHLLFIEQQGVTADGRHFIDMELCDYTLEDYIYRPANECVARVPALGSAPLPNRDEASCVLEIFIQIGTAVAFIHEHGYIHRDITPRKSNTDVFCRLLI